MGSTFKYFLLACIPFSECIFYRWSGWRRKSKVWWGRHVPGYSQFLPYAWPLAVASKEGMMLVQSSLQAGFPDGTSGNLPMQEMLRDEGLSLGWRRSPGVGNGSLLQYSCLENSMDRGACWWGHKESDTTEHTQPPTHCVTFPLRFPPPQLIWGSTFISYSTT